MQHLDFEKKKKIAQFQKMLWKTPMNARATIPVMLLC